MKFKINDFLELRLEDGRTNIYVAEEKFNQCKFLMINIPTNRVDDFDVINSIDEAKSLSDELCSKMETDHDIVSPIDEFWGHCSNLEAWAENNYDTRLLEMRLAFPLLKKLSDAGDLTAKRVFKDEVASRLDSGFAPTIAYLIEEGYHNYFKPSELRALDTNKIYDSLFKEGFLSAALKFFECTGIKPVFNDSIVQPYYESYLSYGWVSDALELFKLTDIKPSVELIDKYHIKW